MSEILIRIRDAGARAWLTFLQFLNGIAGTLLGAAVVVHTVYPDVVRQLLGKLSPAMGALALLAFCVVVHLAARQAKKQA